jgi:hypothetical protein
MKRYKVKITDRNGFHKEFEDGSLIFGSYGEPHKAVLSLNQQEHGELIRLLTNSRPDEALFKFSQSNVLTTWHKRVICDTFPQITKQVTIEIL